MSLHQGFLYILFWSCGGICILYLYEIAGKTSRCFVWMYFIQLKVFCLCLTVPNLSHFYYEPCAAWPVTNSLMLYFVWTISRHIQQWFWLTVPYCSLWLLAESHPWIRYFTDSFFLSCSLSCNNITADSKIIIFPCQQRCLFPHALSSRVHTTYFKFYVGFYLCNLLCHHPRILKFLFPGTRKTVITMPFKH